MHSDTHDLAWQLLQFINANLEEQADHSGIPLGECTIISPQVAPNYYLATLYMWDHTFHDAKLVAQWFNAFGITELSIVHTLYDANNLDALDEEDPSLEKRWDVYFYLPPELLMKKQTHLMNEESEMLPKAPFNLNSPFGKTTTVQAWHYVTLNNGQLTMPSDFFKAVDEVVITPHPEGALLIYSKEKWDKIKAALSSAPKMAGLNSSTLGSGLPEQTHIERVVSQQINIPSLLTHFANLENEAIWLETQNHVELWQPNHLEHKISNNPN